MLMKFSKLLVLSALSLFGLSAQATIVDGVRQMPVPGTSATYELGDTVYLYNPGAGKFFTAHTGSTGAPYYGTRASVDAEGQQVVFVVTDAALEKGEDVVELKNYVPKFSTFLSAFAGGVSDFWCDNDTRDDRFWKVTANGGYYRISNVVAETDKFAGWNYAANDILLYLLDANSSTAYIDWILVKKDDYADFKEKVKEVADLLPTYCAARQLKGAIDEAKAAGADVSAQEALYLNEDATEAELKAAISVVEAAKQEAIKNAAIQNASIENPADFTSFITNPTFDGNSYTGWVGSGFGGNGAKDNAERYQMNYDTYQIVKSLVKGVYIVGVNAFYRAGNAQPAYDNYKAGNEASRYAKLYAAVGKDTVETAIVSPFTAGIQEAQGVGSESTATDSETSQSYIIPNNMVAAEYWMHTLGFYKNQLVIGIDTDSLIIGSYKKTTITGDWAIFDDFSLKYIGSKPEAYQYWVKQTQESSPAISVDGMVCTQSYLDAYNAKKAANSTASTWEEAMAEIKGLQSAIADLEQNIDLWKQLQALIEDAEAVVANDALDPDYTGELGEWIEYDTDELIAKHDLTNGALTALIAEKQAEIDEAKKHPISETDATNLLTNPDFEQGTKGWTGFKTVASQKWNDSHAINMPTTGGTSTNTCAEAFSSPDFDLYQVVENAPVGVYEISVQGFYRYGRGANAWKWFQEQEVSYVKPKGAPVYVYLNAAQTPFQNVYDEPQADGFYTSTDYQVGTETDGTVYPNGMASAAEAFSAGMYTQKAYGLVAKEGDAMRIGVKGNSTQTDDHDSWVIFDNFKLTWKGYQASVIKPVLEEQIVKSKETTSKPMDKDLFAELNAAIAAAEASLAEANGKVMFACLSDLYDVDAKVTASAAVFAKLVAANENLAKEIEVATQAGRTSALAEATALNEQLTAGIEGHTIAEADVEAKINEINGLISRLRMPNQDKIDAASDENPVDMTSLIQNPTFDESANGWSGTTAAWGGDKGALAELFNQNYNFYQEFAGMPAGTYQVSVQAFYRSGAAVNDYNTLDSLNTTHAFLYGAAIQGTDTLMNAKPLQRLGTIVNFEGYEFKSISDEEVTDYAVVVTDTIDKGTDAESYLRTFVPNMMNTANDAFLNGWFSDNVVTIKLAEGETLRIGLLKTTLLANDWTIFDNWKLTYFGKNSAKEATGDNVTAIRTLDGEGETVKVEFFTLDGRKAGAAQKGLIIVKQTLDNGSVIVKKIRK